MEPGVDGARCREAPDRRPGASPHGCEIRGIQMVLQLDYWSPFQVVP